MQRDTDLERGTIITTRPTLYSSPSLMTPEHRSMVFLADMLDDVEAERIAAENRVRSAETEGLTNFLDSAFLAEHVETLKHFETITTKRLEKAVKDSPFGSFVLNQKGVGLKTVGRLLGVIGDPYWHPHEDRPRTVSELWAYCGLNPDAPDRKRGMTQDDAMKRGNPRARKALYVITNTIVKVGGPYRMVYDARKAETEGRLHTKVCRNSIKPVAGAPQGSNGCGTRANPEMGEVGSPWRDGHRHTDACRVVAKTLLKDLYDVAKRFHQGDQLAKRDPRSNRSLGEGNDFPDRGTTIRTRPNR